MSKKLEILLNDEIEVITIEGINYSYDFFRALSKSGLDVGKLFRILNREDGVVCIGTVGENLHPDGE